MMTCVSLNTWEQECAKMKIHFPNLYGIVENDTDVSNSYGFDPLTNAFLQVTWWCSNQNCDAQTRIIHVQLSYMSRDLPSTEVCSTALYFPWSIWSVYKKNALAFANFHLTRSNLAVSQPKPFLA